jgi:hypothetical protein
MVQTQFLPAAYSSDGLLGENDCFNPKTYPDELPEAALRDRLANWLENNDLARKTML